jgi:hypothetical protein
MVMQSAKDCQGQNAPDVLDGSGDWCILAKDMRSSGLVKLGVSAEHVTQMLLAEHDHMITTHSRRIEPISRSAWPFCQGDRGAVGLSRIPIA